jgi:hypothetical protein
LDESSASQIILDSRDKQGRGVLVKTAEHDTVRIEISDGEHAGFWSCDRRLIAPGAWRHVAIIVDGGPKVISFVVDGTLCDGGPDAIYGWGRFHPDLGDVSGASEVRLAPSRNVRLRRLRVYNRYLRTSEAIANHHAGA